MKFDVIVVGSYSIDLLFSGMSDIPQIGKDLLSKEFLETPGEAFTAAVALHRLGFNVGWAADFGNDYYSLLALDRSRSEGLDESLFMHHNRPYKRISVAFTYPQDRGFITYYDPDPPIPAAIHALTTANAEFLFIPGLYTGAFFQQGAKLAKMKKMKLAMDGNSSEGDMVGYSRQSLAIRKSISTVDVFIPNAEEARRLTGSTVLDEAAQKLGTLCPLVVIKDGPNGSIACCDHKLVHVPGIPIVPIDTTGAGDNFNSAFLRGWFDGESIEKCLQWGNISGGLASTSLGGTTKIITKETLLDASKQYYSD